MRSFPLRLLIAVPSLFFSSFVSLSQTGTRSSPQISRTQPLHPDTPRLVYYETCTLPGTDSARSRVDIPFRISYNFFVFVRNEQAVGDTASQFIAKVDITTELLDQAGASVARQMMRKEIGTSEPERSTARDEFLQGIFSFTVPAGEYTVVFQIDDLESNQQYLDKSRTAAVRDFGKDSLELSDVLFIEPPGSSWRETAEFTPVNLGGDVFFGRNFAAYLEIIKKSPASAALRISYSLYKRGEIDDDTTYYAKDSSLHDVFREAQRLVIHQKEHSYLYRLEQQTAPDRLSALLRLRGDELPQGNYELLVLVTDGLHSKSRVYPFRARWVNMPRSLSNADLAVDALEYIATKEEMSSLKSMFNNRRKEQFEEFWRKRDPTPRTALNEAMAEYYRRVDYAMEHLASLGTPLGYKTDRGKIYVLYGHPARTDRQFSPTAPPREIWEYDSVKKRFVFVDAGGHGDYKLVATENLQ